MSPASPTHERPQSNAELSPTQRWMRTCLTGGWCLVGLMGTLVGISPWLNKLVLGAIGRENVSIDAMHAPPLQIAAILGLQLAAFIGIYGLLSRPTAPRFALPCVTLLYIAVVIGAWWPVRLDEMLVRLDSTTVLEYRTGQDEPIRLTGEEATKVWAVRPKRDEAREIMVIREMNLHGPSGFFSADSRIANARQQHPPTVYWLFAQFPFDPLALRTLCAALYVLGIVGLASWLYLFGGSDVACRGMLALASAPGVFGFLVTQVNLDVVVFLLSLVVPFCFFRSSKSQGERDSTARLLALGGVLAGLVMLKFTALVLVVGVAVALFPSLRLRTVYIVAPSALAFVAYHVWLSHAGEPFANTYLGEYYYAFTAGKQRRFEGGGFAKSFVSLVVFVLGPLAFTAWLVGLGAEVTRRLPKLSDSAKPDWRVALLAVTSVLFVYVVHPLFRYLSPSLWAIVAAIGQSYTDWRRGRMLTDGLLAAAASYGMMKLLLDSYM